MHRPATQGFTLIEPMVAVAILDIFAAVALPSTWACVRRSGVPPALGGSSVHAVRIATPIDHQARAIPPPSPGAGRSPPAGA